MKLVLSDDDCAFLQWVHSNGDSTERRRAQILMDLNTGNLTWRETASHRRVSLNTVIRAVKWFRNGGIRRASVRRVPRGRRSGMRFPEVKAFLGDWVGRKAEPLNEATIVETIKERFGITLSPKSLRYWLCQWNLKLAKPNRRSQQRPSNVRALNLTPPVCEFIDSELVRLNDAWKETMRRNPDEKFELNQFSMQINQLEALRNSCEKRMSQAAIAEELGVREETVNRWLNSFRRWGNDVAAVKKLLDMHRP